MSAVFPALGDKLIAFIKAQPVFFVATAPLSPEGHVNVSPKGYDSLVVLDPLTVAWLDFGGSGVETLAHLKENGRITLMVCAFSGAARILRLHGRGEAVAFDQPDYPRLRALFAGETKARAVIVVKLTRIADSCGWGVPFMEFKGEREQLRRWIDKTPEAEWAERRYAAGARSIDGLPGLARG